MKIRITLLIALVGLFHATVSSAQIQAAAGTTIAGTPYLDDAFTPGEILIGGANKKVPVRYNIYQDLMEYKQNGQPLVLDPNTTIKKVKLNNSTYVVDKFEFKGKTKYGFLTLVDSGKITLLAKKVVTFMDAKKGGALDGSDSPAKFTRAPDVFYYKTGNGEPVRIENVKKLIASLPDKMDELTQFAKKEKISAKKEAELLKLIQYYNSL